MKLAEAGSVARPGFSPLREAYRLGPSVSARAQVRSLHVQNGDIAVLRNSPADTSFLDDHLPELDRASLGRIHVEEIDALVISGDIVTVVQPVEEVPRHRCSRRQTSSADGIA